MRNPTLLKYTVFFFAVLALVGLDQWTKNIAETRLATQRPGAFSHSMVLEVPESFDGSTLESYLREELRANSEEEIREIAQFHTRSLHGARLNPDSDLQAGDEIEIRQREVVVIKDYWDFQYTRNPGAAFGLLADSDSPLRTPFFIIISLIAVIVILGLLRGVPLNQHILFWALTFIAGGALGNFIDRVRLGYVIDFIVWKVSDEYRWPTFNIADVLICVGVALMILEMIREVIAERRIEQTVAE